MGLKTSTTSAHISVQIAEAENDCVSPSNAVRPTVSGHWSWQQAHETRGIYGVEMDQRAYGLRLECRRGQDRAARTRDGFGSGGLAALMKSEGRPRRLSAKMAQVLAMSVTALHLWEEDHVHK